MRRGAWHLRQEGPVLTLSRHWPPRFDVEARTSLPRLRGSVLAHEIRKDLWRGLRKLRGFAPVVELTQLREATHVRAGGRTSAPVPGDTEARIAAILEEPALRRRWIRHAGCAR